MSNCDKGKILNPRTGRCVKIDGAVGRELLKLTKTQIRAECKKYGYSYDPKGTCKSKKRKPSKSPKRRKTPPRSTSSPVRKTIKNMQAYCRGKGLVYDRDDKKCRPSKRPGNKAVAPQPISGRSTSSPVRKTIKNMQAYCRGKGLVYDRDDKKCRPSKRRGRQAVAPQPKVSPKIIVSSPQNDIREIVEDCSQNNKMVRKKLIGAGQYGQVYIVCKGDDCDYVLKAQKVSEEYKTEVQTLIDLQNTDIVPKLYAAWTCDGVGYFVIEKLVDCMSTKLTPHEIYTQTKSLLEKFKAHGFLHVDIKQDNVMCRKNKVVLIDFGWAVKQGTGVMCEPKKEPCMGGTMVWPKHPLSERKGIPLTWDELLIFQNNNFENGFGTYNSPAFLEAQKRRNELLTILYQRLRDFNNS